MNFIEAAIAILGETGRPMTVEELTELALERELLSRPGKTPLRSMKTRLTSEANKGDEGKVEQLDDDRWKLRNGAAAAPKRGAGKAAPKAGAKAKAAPKAGAKGAKAAPKAGAKAAPKAKAAAKPSPKGAKKQIKGEALMPEERAEMLEGEVAAEAPVAEEPSALQPAAETAAAAAAAEELAPEALEVEERPLAPEELPEDEREAAAVYGDELAPMEPAAAHAEYSDEQTADEDRPLMPEIVAQRRDRWRDRREQRRREQREGRRRRRDRRGREGREERAEPRERPEAEAVERAPREERVERAPREERAERPAAREEARPALAPVARTATGADVVPYRPGNPIGDAAEAALTELRDRQPVQVKQLTQMMRKRRLVEGNPEEMWPHVKAALLQDADSYRQYGLRPRIVYRGRDLFVLAGHELPDELRKAEVEYAEALSQLAAATHRALQARLSALSPTALERLTHAWLVRTGWRRVEWIKRVERSSYAIAEAANGLGEVLIGVRAGSQEVDRRGVGELRAGVEAKDLISGLLLAPRPLSDEAGRELERGGRPVATLCGDAFVTALIDAGVGVQRAATPMFLLNEQYLNELE